jgi:DNA polymerase III subunit epsilon
MKLTRPLVILDIEATGVEVSRDRIVTLYCLKVVPGGIEFELDIKCNPGIQMTEEVIAIHGITNEMVKNWPPFEEYARNVLDFINGCDICGFNAASFDAPMLFEEFLRAGLEWNLEGISIVDPGTIFKKKEERSLTAAVKFYCKRTHDGAHGAKADVLATRDVLYAQLNRYEDLADMGVVELGKYSMTDKDGNERVDLNGTIVRNKEGVPVFNTKRNKGVPVTSDTGYASWIIRSDFPTQTKRTICKILDEA